MRVRLGFAGIPRFLGLVEALVGGFEKFGGREAVGRVKRMANADGECRRVALHAKATADALGDVLRSFRVGVQQQNRELISPVTSGYFRAAAVFLHNAGQAIEGVIPGKMAEAIVDAFQVVEIEQEQRKRPLRAFGAPHLALEALEEFPIVGEPGQAVMTGTEAYFFFRLLALGNIESHADAPDNRPLRIAVRPDAQIVDAIAAGVFETGRNATESKDVLRNG